MKVIVNISPTSAEILFEIMRSYELDFDQALERMIYDSEDPREEHTALIGVWVETKRDFERVCNALYKSDEHVIALEEELKIVKSGLEYWKEKSIKLCTEQLETYPKSTT